MSTLRLSRYSEDHYYYEMWADGRCIITSGQPECGDFTPSDLQEFVETYVDIKQVVIVEPDAVERKSDTRTEANACPSKVEVERLRAYGRALGIPVHVIVEEYYL